MVRALKETFPGKDFHLDKKNLTISVEWALLCKVVVLSAEVHKFQWKETVVQKYGVDKNAVAEKVNQARGTNADEPWCG